MWNSTQGTTIETDTANGTTRLIIDTNILPNPATVIVTAENKLGSDQCFALLQINEPKSRIEEEKLTEQGNQQTRIQDSPSRRVLEEKLHESGQDSVSMLEASDLQRRSTDERLEEHAQSRTEGSIEMGQIESRNVTTERLDEKLKVVTSAPNFGNELPLKTQVKEGEQIKLQVAAENADNFDWKLNNQPLQVRIETKF